VNSNLSEKSKKKFATSSTIVVVLVWMQQHSKARILQGKILVRNPKIHGWIFGSMFSAMQIENFEKIRHKDAAAQEGENFASQNSRQESRNPWMDFWFHVFGNANANLSEKSKKFFLIFWRFRTFVILQVVFVITVF